MSRCIPFPRPGYARNWANGQNLVESTKHERDLVDLKKAFRKEKKKEKKERRKEKKEKEGKSRKAVDAYRKNVDRKLGQQYDSSKKIVDESEQLEKSALTEEHEQPQNLCYLSDGTQSNKKRKMPEPPAVESRSQGKPLRIRFVFKKPKEPEAVPAPDDERVCSTSGAEHLPSKEKVVQDTRASGVTSTSSSEQAARLPLIAGENEGSAIPIDTARKKHKKSKESQYEALFENWVPPVISFALDGCNDDDQDWLFGSKKREKPAAKVVKTDEDMNMSLSCGGSSWPRAQFLPDVGIHSLPYTIPF